MAYASSGHLAYLTVTNAFAALRLPPMSDRDKDVEILVLRRQTAVLRRQLGADIRARFGPEDRAFLTALSTSLPREVLRRLRLRVDFPELLPKVFDRTELSADFAHVSGRFPDGGLRDQLVRTGRVGGVRRRPGADREAQRARADPGSAARPLNRKVRPKSVPGSEAPAPAVVVHQAVEHVAAG
ncbi:hypothetical protein ACFQYP_33310 [Nonomuraea antimicrobica]|uniref:hypothetical protein n=1 Tax=Nonomuraea antimicrobica TaxID=561173 RepID=UPI0031EBAB80